MNNIEELVAATTHRYTIIIPVFGALEHVKRCLESVLANTDLVTHRLLVIDDASKDGDVLRYVTRRIRDAVDCKKNLKFVYHDRNVGFVRTANEGIKQALEWETDPVLLNSDTIVPPRWIERMDTARTRAQISPYARVCSVSPLSNRCTQYSVPNQWDGELPKGVSVEEMDRIVEATSGHKAPTVQTNVGFCMLMTRAAIEAVGVFDTRWGKGYGEETDWCERAKAAGFSCVLADDVYVYHEHRASFGPKAASHWKENQETFEQLYPNFREQLEVESLNHPLTAHRVRIADRLRPRAVQSLPSRRKVLYVCHNWGSLGGLEIFQKRLVEEVAKLCEITVLHPRRGDQIESTAFVQEPNGVLRIAVSPRLAERNVELGIFPFEFQSRNMERVFSHVMDAIDPDVVHFHHSGGYGTFELAKIASQSARVVYSVHDDFLLCPSYLTAGWQCGRTYAEDCEQCRTCVHDNMTVLKEGRITERLSSMLQEREARISSMLAYVDALVFPSLATCKRFGERFDHSLQYVIPHGVPRPRFVGTYAPTERLRVAWVGGVMPEKGWDAFANAARALRDDSRFHFSVIGDWHDMADRSRLEHVKWHGRYQSHELAQLLQSVDLAVPAVARKESYGLVVDECLAAGCPVLLPRVPAMLERCDTHYDWGDAVTLERLLVECAESCLGAPPGAMLATRLAPSLQGWRSMADCAADYLRLYEDVTCL